MKERIRAKHHRGGSNDGTDTETYRRADRERNRVLVHHTVGLRLTTEIQEPNQEGSHATKRGGHEDETDHQGSLDKRSGCRLLHRIRRIRHRSRGSALLRHLPTAEIQDVEQDTSTRQRGGNEDEADDYQTVDQRVGRGLRHHVSVDRHRSRGSDPAMTTPHYPRRRARTIPARALGVL